jgi:pyruvate kinase
VVANIDKIVAIATDWWYAWWFRWRGKQRQKSLTRKNWYLLQSVRESPVLLRPRWWRLYYTFTPTRAEVNDVANSVMDGVDADVVWRNSVGKSQKLTKWMAEICRNVVQNSELISETNVRTYQIRTNRCTLLKLFCHHAALMAKSRLKPLRFVHQLIVDIPFSNFP